MSGERGLNLSSDDIRRRVSRRRMESPLWGACSFAFHVMLFVAIVLCTPAKELFRREDRKPSDAARDLSADRIEQISDELSKIRVNELLEQLEAMQAVLHNMDMMKEQLQRDYEDFANSQQAGPTLEETRKRLLSIAADVESNQVAAVAGHAAVRSAVELLTEAESQDIRDKDVSRKLRELSDGVIAVSETMANTQGNAQNMLDRIQSDAAFAGLGKSSAAAEALRDAQVEVARMQNVAQDEAVGIGFKLAEYSGSVSWYGGEKRGLENEKRNRTSKEAELKNARLALGDARERFEEDSRDAEEARREFEALSAEEKDLEELLKAEREALREARRS